MPGEFWTRSSPSTPCTCPVGRTPGLAVRKRIASGRWKRRLDELVRDRLARCLPKGDVDEVDTDAEADEVRHLAGGDARRDLNDDHVAVRRDEQLREGDPVLESERTHRGNCDHLGDREGVGAELGRIEMNPADAESAARRPQPVGEGDEPRLAATTTTIPFSSEPSTYRSMIARLLVE